MVFTSAQGHRGLTALGPCPWPRLSAFGWPMLAGAASTCTAHSRHAWPWPERAQWRAHRRLNDGGNPEQIEGKWSLDIDLHATTRKPRRGGQEGGAHRGRRFCNGARANGEESSMRGRRSSRGGWRSGRRGAPWWHGTRCRVSGVGKQLEKAATSEVLMEEDDGRGIPLPGFASRRCRQVLGAGGARWWGASFGPVGQLGGGSSAADNDRWSGGRCGVEQWGGRIEWCEGEVEWMVASSVMSRAGIRGGQPTWGGDDRQPPVLSCSPRGEHGHQE
jgi:hypothetical protein